MSLPGDPGPGVSLFSGPDTVCELRAITSQGISSGYFRGTGELSRQAAALDTDPKVHGIYVTLNEVNPALFARSADRIRMRLGARDATTSDADILRRRWFPIDIDPVRPSGVSSSDAEHSLALAKAEEIAGWLSQFGFPAPVRGDSGNGAHLLYRIDLPNDADSLRLVKQGLAVLDTLFSDREVTVDTANYNAARIWKLYGTVSRKGDSTPERPHRRSQVIAIPQPVLPVSRDLLSNLAGLLPAEVPEEPAAGRAAPGTPARIDLKAWLASHGICVRSEKPWNGGTLYVLNECPFSSAHTDGAYAIQYGNGAIFAGCHHDSCGGGKQRWKELREKFEGHGQETAAGHVQENGGADAELNGNGSRITAINCRQVYGTVAVPDRRVPDGDGKPGRKFPLTDAGNAERLVARFGTEIRYCAAASAWFVWNGKVWERDDSGKMLLLATETARSIHAEAAQAGTIEEARALGRWAVATESLYARKAMIESAAPLVPIAPHAFDAGPMLFNARNGTLDLATLTFRKFEKEDMLTRMATVDYLPGTDCPLWKSHLELIFAGDTETIRGFQAMCGYSLLGMNPEQVMFILYGKGRNGKSKTIEVLARILGNYAVNIAAESLTVHRFETARSDLARLAGARMATAGEGEDGARLAESVIKQLTGEYAITVRRLYENEFEFTPNAKIWLSTNHEPVIRGTDDGIWRRIWMVPFTVQIPQEKRDPEIAEKLLAESSGILNWCLDGLRMYRENGNRLLQPAKVARATSAFRTVSDTIGLFLATECTFEPGAKMARGALKEMLEKWCEEEGVRQRISGRKLAEVLKEKGVRDGGRSGSERYWNGIRTKFDEERQELEKMGSFQDVLGI